MKKRIIELLLCIAMLLLILGMFVLSVRICANDEAWIEKEYNKLDINDYTGMSTEDMCRAYMCMVNYMDGKIDSMELEVSVDGSRVQMFNEKEIRHMDDVRRLYKGVEVFMWCCFAAAGCTIAAAGLLLRKEAAASVLKGYIVGLAVIVCAALALVIWGTVDFSGFWIKFHEIFLDLEGSTFDPMYSRMIRICPEKLFSDIIVRILVVGAGLLTFTGGLLIFLRKICARSHSSKEKAV